jgi:hypothetical protein
MDVGDSPIVSHHPCILQDLCCGHELFHAIDAEVVFRVANRLAPQALYDLDEGLHVGLLMVADAYEVLIYMAANLVAKPVEDSGAFDLALVVLFQMAPVELVLQTLQNEGVVEDVDV